MDVLRDFLPLEREDIPKIKPPLHKKQQDYSERDSLIELFSAESVSKVLWDDITKLCR